MILIDTALQSEAQAFIEFYKLEKLQSSPKIYKNNYIVLLISGIGKDNTIKNLQYIFMQYDITKAINIGIAGCNNKAINIGELFCTNHKLNNINHTKLITSNTPISNKDFTTNQDTVLIDMEGKYFIDIASKHLENKNLYIFKIVSDYLDDTIPNKDFIKNLIRKQIKIINYYMEIE